MFRHLFIFLFVLSLAFSQTKIIDIKSEKSLSERITDGNFGYVLNGVFVEGKFPERPDQNYQVKYKLFHFNKTLSSEEVIKLIKKQGFEPASIYELLAFAEVQPDLQETFPIVSLGSGISNFPKGSYWVPVLDSYESKRMLRLSWFGEDYARWPIKYRFLGICKLN